MKLPAALETHVNRVDRQRALMIGISTGLLAYRAFWALYLTLKLRLPIRIAGLADHTVGRHRRRRRQHVSSVHPSLHQLPEAAPRVTVHDDHRRQMLALPAFHCDHGMFQSPRPSVPGRGDPTVLTISTMSPRLALS